MPCISIGSMRTTGPEWIWMQPGLPTNTMIGVPSNEASSSSSRTALVSARCVNSPSVRRKLCWRSTSNLFSRPKNSCVSCMPRQASASATASMALSSRGAAFFSAGANCTGSSGAAV
ncbi:hypothetical protein D9M72_66820 [compost metagenome]